MSELSAIGYALVRIKVDPANPPSSGDVVTFDVTSSGEPHFVFSAPGGGDAFDGTFTGGESGIALTTNDGGSIVLTANDSGGVALEGTVVALAAVDDVSVQAGEFTWAFRSTGSTQLGALNLFNSDADPNGVVTALAAGDLCATTEPALYQAGAADNSHWAKVVTVPGVPTVTSVSPLAGSINGSAGVGVVTITGTNLRNALRVQFDAELAPIFDNSSDTELLAIAPPHGFGAVDIQVTTLGGTSAVAIGDGYIYDAIPTITSMSVAGGTTAGGTAVTLTGTGYLTVTAVHFGATAATSFAIVSDASITCVAPAHASGLVDVEVTNTTGTSSAVSADHYTYA